MRTYLHKRDKRDEEKRSLEVIKEEEQERKMNRSMNLQAPRQEVFKNKREEMIRKATARQMWKTEKKAGRRTTFTKSLT